MDLSTYTTVINSDYGFQVMISQGKDFPPLISTSRYKFSHLHSLLLFIFSVLGENFKSL